MLEAKKFKMFVLLGALLAVVFFAWWLVAVQINGMLNPTLTDDMDRYLGNDVSLVIADNGQPRETITREEVRSGRNEFPEPGYSEPHVKTIDHRVLIYQYGNTLVYVQVDANDRVTFIESVGT